MKTGFRSLIVFTISLFVAPAYGQVVPVPPAGSVTIEDISFAGSGCPAGSVAENVADDNKAFTLAFAEYIAEAGPGVPARGNRKNCNLIVDLVFPQGWSFTIFDVDYRGFASLDRRVTGTQKSQYFFQGQFPSAALQTTFVGPIDEDYEFRDELELIEWVWSPCGLDRALNINTQVRVNNRRNRDGTGIMTIDTINGQLIHQYGIAWRQCTEQEMEAADSLQ